MPSSCCYQPQTDDQSCESLARRLYFLGVTLTRLNPCTAHFNITSDNTGCAQMLLAADTYRARAPQVYNMKSPFNNCLCGHHCMIGRRLTSPVPTRSQRIQRWHHPGLHGSGNVNSLYEGLGSLCMKGSHVEPTCRRSMAAR